MCGIFGMIGKSNIDFQKVKLLMYLNRDRGTDGVGIYVNDKIYKEDLDARSFLYTIGNVTTNLALGHTRKTSVGKSVKDNTHPFEIGNIIGAHNGTLTNIDELKKITGKNYDVDSQYIIHLLDGTTPEETFRQLEGTFALWWVDKRFKDKVFLFRKTSPINLVHEEDYVLFSSDYYDVMAVKEVNDKKIHEIKESYLMEIDTNTLAIKYTKITGLRKDKVTPAPILSYEESVPDVYEAIDKPSKPFDEPVILPSIVKGKTKKKDSRFNDDVVRSLPFLKQCDTCGVWMHKDKLERVGDTYICNPCILRYTKETDDTLFDTIA